MRILLVNNLSAEPFRLIHPCFASSVEERAPAETWRIAQEELADLALVPVARIAHVASVMEPIGNFGVACFGAVGSVLLLSQEPISALIEQERPIYLTQDSESSKRLLLWLVSEEYGRRINSTCLSDNCIARLCIGDKALRTRMLEGVWPYVIDLCEWWSFRTGLPFVFARWVVRRSCDDLSKRLALDWLTRCTQAAREEEGLSTMASRTMQRGLFKTSLHARSFFLALISAFTQRELEGEQKFLKILSEASSTQTV